MWLVFYFLIFGMCELIWGVLGWVGITVGVRSDLVAFYITSFIAVVLLPSLAYSQTEDSVEQLYPETAGLRSAYYGMISKDSRRLSLTTLAASIGLILFMVFGILFRWSLGGVLYVLQVTLFFFSLVIVPPDARVSRRKSIEEIISAVSALFEAAGYEVELKPRTQDSVVDPLLMEVDLVATRDGQHLFIDVKTGAERKRSLDWRSVSALKQASWILSERRNLRLEESNARLIMVDVPQDATLETASGEENIPIVYLASEEIHQVLQAADSQEKQTRALSLLGLLPINEESTPAID
jgi:hypothetical protein